MSNSYPEWADWQIKAQIEMQTAQTMAVLLLADAIDRHADPAAFIALMRERIDNTAELMTANSPGDPAIIAEMTECVRVRLHRMLDKAPFRYMPRRGSA